jgi:3-oxoacyl-[acyl-carrier protein] reductase
MDLGLTGKIALVTGASSGIGAATAMLLAQEGADVVVGYGRDKTGAQTTAQAVQVAGQRAWLHSFDLENAQSVFTEIDSIKADAGRLDILVLCAGKNVITPFEEISPQEWEHILAVNLSGPFYTIRAALPLMKAGGAVVTVASVAAHTGAPHHAHYAAAKAGLVNLTKSCARALAPRIRVNCVAPGITLTQMGLHTTSSLPPDYAQTKLLTGRFAEPDEIARCIVFLASPAASFITGATLDANGGRDLR